MRQVEKIVCYFVLHLLAWKFCFDFDLFAFNVLFLFFHGFVLFWLHAYVLAVICFCSF